MTDFIDATATESVGGPDDTTQPYDFPMARQSSCPFAPPPEYAEMRASNPVAKAKLRWSGKPVWLVSKHEDAKRVLGDTTMSSNWKHPGYPLQVPAPDEIIQMIELPMVAMDPPAHRARRRLLTPELTMQRVQALRPRIQQIVDEHVDAMLAAGGPVDLVQALAFPVPALLFCELLGVPVEDSELFKRVTQTLVRSDVEQDEMMAAQQEMEVYLNQLIAAKESADADDVMHRIIVKNREGGGLDRGDIVNIAKAMLFGGYDTASNMIALGTLVLLEHPDQLAELAADPSLIPGAVEELLRYLSIADSSPARVTTQDVEVGGQLIRAGEGIIVLTGSASRDDEAFADADTFDIHRDARGHSAFGHGIHQCPGANVVRVELEVVFATLLRRIPGLRLAVPMESLSFKSGTLVHGVNGELPVTW
ncbi:cytochrome P450 [Nocardia tenerifensis]|uniref:Cytochrome P450 n=3 Tax=Nocardia tenerifensis TaxID=228006 RepID=A0A318KAA4_9NOCA|nr:cytochrome P450 [Nocardia tenerifensis]PXX71491.1 cytochrome P450 [Nocardia tenerifensis]